jgi:hypothetical protein
VQRTQVPAQTRHPLQPRTHKGDLVVISEKPFSPQPTRSKTPSFLPFRQAPESLTRGTGGMRKHPERKEHPPTRELVSEPGGEMEQPVSNVPVGDRLALVRYPDSDQKPAQTGSVPSTRSTPTETGTTTTTTPAVPKEPQGDPGRNSTDKVHAYNVWVFEHYGQLVSGTWLPKNARKFKSYIKTHPPKLVYSPTEGWRPNPAYHGPHSKGTHTNGSTRTTRTNT